MAHETDAAPDPIQAILDSYDICKSFGRFGSGIYLTLISLNTLHANSYNLPISIAPPLIQCALHVEAHNTDTGHNAPQDNPKGLSDNIVLAAP